MDKNFEKTMTKRTDAELIKIVNEQRNDYQPEAIEAAELEIKNRNLTFEQINIKNQEKNPENQIEKDLRLKNRSLKKANFKNKTFYSIVITFLCGLLLYNIVQIDERTMPLIIFPIVIQISLLILILTKNQYAKIGIKIWSIVFLIVASGLQLAGRFLNDFTYSFENINIQSYLITGISLII